ncbi:MAG: hypothetical protein Ta2D_02520 [Rickettsiales bacterium]|nr:MAG: hypothetical protein Ta2D_02520 [Rickettsiales bacterium]
MTETTNASREDIIFKTNMEIINDDDKTELEKENAARIIIQQAQNTNHPASLNFYAYCFEEGIYVCDKDEKEATKWYKTAANLGDVNAMFNYANGLEKGWTGEVNKEEAVVWYQKAADLGHDKYKEIVDKMYYIAMDYEFEEHFKKAIKLYKQLANLGHTDSMYKYAEYLENGIGCTKDLEKAMLSYEKVLELTDRSDLYYGMANEGRNRLKELNNQQINPQTQQRQQLEQTQTRDRKQVVKRAPQEQQKEECIDFFLTETQSKKNKVEKLEMEQRWLFPTFFSEVKERPLQSKEEEAKKIFEYAYVFKEEGNLKGAMIYYERAAKLGHRDAMFNYANGLEKGWTGEVDLEGAIKYYKQAAEKGHAGAMNNIGTCLLNIDAFDEKNKKEAMEWYKKAAEKENVDAMFNYAFGIQNGYIGELDFPEMMKWYKKAAEKGHAGAISFYNNCIEPPETSQPKAQITTSQTPQENSTSTLLNSNDTEKLNNQQINPQTTIIEQTQQIPQENSTSTLLNSNDTDIMFKNAQELEREGRSGEAMVLYKQASDLEHADSMYKYARYLEENVGDSEEILSEAIKLYKKVIELPNSKYIELAKSRFKELNEPQEQITALLKSEDPVTMNSYAFKLAKDNNEFLKLTNLKKAMVLYKKAAELRNTDAMYNYAVGLERGYTGEVNLKGAMIWYKQAIKKRNVAAMYNYALCLESQDSKKEAIGWYKIAADLGHPIAMYDYAYNLEKGYNGEVDLLKAREYYEKAKELGNTDAINRLKELDNQQINPQSQTTTTNSQTNNTQNESTTRKVSKEQSKKEHVKFILPKKDLDNIYTNACNIEKNGDLEKAIEYYKQAADAGHVGAMYNYAWNLEKGDSSIEDKKEAMNWYRKAGEKGNIFAINNYGIGLKEGYLDDTEYLPEAKEWYKKMADKEDIKSKRYLKKLNNQQNNFQSETTTTNQKQTRNQKSQTIKTALREQADIEKILSQDDPKNIYNNAYNLENGIDCEANLPAAMKLYKEAAELGHVNAMYNYAYNLEEGNGCEKNLPKAMIYYEWAAELGHIDAMFNYAHNLKSGIGCEKNEKNEKKANYYYEQAYKRAAPKEQIEAQNSTTTSTPQSTEQTTTPAKTPQVPETREQKVDEVPIAGDGKNKNNHDIFDRKEIFKQINPECKELAEKYDSRKATDLEMENFVIKYANKYLSAINDIRNNGYDFILPDCVKEEYKILEKINKYFDTNLGEEDKKKSWYDNSKTILNTLLEHNKQITNTENNLSLIDSSLTELYNKIADTMVIIDAEDNAEDDNGVNINKKRKENLKNAFFNDFQIPEKRYINTIAGQKAVSVIYEYEKIKGHKVVSAIKRQTFNNPEARKFYIGQARDYVRQQQQKSKNDTSNISIDK